jgi:hypothetical protein
VIYCCTYCAVSLSSANAATATSPTFLTQRMGDYHPATVSKYTSTHHHVAPKPRFIITGFGRFCGVAQNPTEQLVGWLQQRSHTKAETAAPAADNQQEQHSINRAMPEQPYCISSLDVLEVSADAVDHFMQKQQEAILQQATAASISTGGPQPVVLLHFGVDTKVCDMRRSGVHDRTGLSWAEATRACQATASAGRQSSWAVHTHIPSQACCHLVNAKCPILGQACYHLATARCPYSRA